MKIITEFLTGWNVASKTQPIKAKPLINLLVDRTVANKFLVDTLEAKEPVSADALFCIGAAGDAWQQMPRKLLAKYDVTAIEDGWMICTPKPDNAVNCIETTPDMLKTLVLTEYVTVPFNDPRKYNLCDFAIEGQWGSAEYPEIGKNIQLGHKGDFICQNRTDPTDVWIVKRKLFLNTYVLKN